MVDSDRLKLFVGGISWDTTEDVLRDHFFQYGQVSSSAIAKDRYTGTHRGFGFVTFSDPSAAEKALEDEHIIVGRKVEVKRAIPRNEQQQSPQIHHQHQNQQHCNRSLGRSSNGSNYGGSNNDSNFSSKKIFVGGLSANLTEEEFKNYFEKFGRITDVVVMHDNVTNRPRGFGFITFDSEEVVDNIVQKSFYEVGGKQVEVKRAVPKEVSRNSNGGSNMRVGVGKGSSFPGYPQENHWSNRARYPSGMHPSHVSFPPYGGVGGYYYGPGVFVGGYPMYSAVGYGVPWVAHRSPWNGLGMLGVSPAQYPHHAVYSTNRNGGFDATEEAESTEKSDLGVGGDNQVIDNVSTSQIDGERSELDASRFEKNGQGVLYNENRKAHCG